MAAMLLVLFGRAFSVLVLGVFVAGLGWALSHGFRRTTRAAYLRLAVGCAAMTVMLLPAATASAASTASANAPTTPGGIHHMDQAMPAMAQLVAMAPREAPVWSRRRFSWSCCSRRWVWSWSSVCSAPRVAPARSRCGWTRAVTWPWPQPWATCSC